MVARTMVSSASQHAAGLEEDEEVLAMCQALEHKPLKQLLSKAEASRTPEILCLQMCWLVGAQKGVESGNSQAIRSPVRLLV
jgi:hypothetical protein